jgi:hypothetical protein
MRLFCHKIIIQQLFYFPRIPNEYKTAIIIIIIIMTWRVP